MNLLVKRNVEEFLRLLGNGFYLFESRVEIDFNGFSFFIEIIDNNGKHWVYANTHLETESVWRND